jgi:hypothetical protein
MDHVLGEIINIMLNTTYYDKGVLLNDKKPKHNTYFINGVKHEISPNIILIAFTSSIDIDIMYSTIARSYNEFIAAVCRKWGSTPILSAGAGTTEYMAFNSVSDSVNVTCELIDNLNRISKRKDESEFMIYVYNGGIPISGLSFGDPNNIYSLSSIVVSLFNEFTLPDGFMGPDYPRCKDYTLAHKIVDKPINFSIHYGLHVEIIKHFDNVILYDKVFMTVFGTNKWNTPYLVDWNWLQNTIYTADFDELTPTKLIKGGLLDRPPVDIKEYRCFLTGCPIFDDCYVFDIYQRNVTTVSKVNNKQVKTVSKIHYDEPKCVLISPYCYHFNYRELSKFFADCESEYIIYRTKCHVKFADILRYSTADEQMKKLLLHVYDNAMMDAYSITCKNNITLCKLTPSAVMSGTICNFKGSLMGIYRDNINVND